MRPALARRGDLPAINGRMERLTARNTEPPVQRLYVAVQRAWTQGELARELLFTHATPQSVQGLTESSAELLAASLPRGSRQRRVSPNGYFLAAPAHPLIARRRRETWHPGAPAVSRPKIPLRRPATDRGKRELLSLKRSSHSQALLRVGSVTEHRAGTHAALRHDGPRRR